MTDHKEKLLDTRAARRCLIVFVVLLGAACLGWSVQPASALILPPMLQQPYSGFAPGGYSWPALQTPVQQPFLQFGPSLGQSFLGFNYGHNRFGIPSLQVPPIAGEQPWHPVSTPWYRQQPFPTYFSQAGAWNSLPGALSFKPTVGSQYPFSYVGATQQPAYFYPSPAYQYPAYGYQASPIYQQPQTLQPAQTRSERIASSIQRALSWVRVHPARFGDGGFVEMAEETICFYLLARNAVSSAAEEGYLDEIRQRVNFLGASRGLQVTAGDYTMVVAVAAIAKEIGIESAAFHSLIVNQLLPDPALCSNHVTTCLWNSLYLDRLGYWSPVIPEQLMPQTMLAKELQQRSILTQMRSQEDPALADQIVIPLYDITHEIFCLTDFGDLAAPPLVWENLAFFSQFFDTAISWAVAHNYLDLAAEFIMCVTMLDLYNVPSFNKGIDFILASQQPDGSFGITNPSRRNVYRHGLLVALMALSGIS